MSRGRRIEPHDAQRRSADARAVIAPDVQAGLRSETTVLSDDVRRDMQQRFGRAFSDVRVHSGPHAAGAADALGAAAFTVGNHIVFGERRFDPRSSTGRGLIAHELTHVLQQSPGNGAGASQSTLEAQARHNARSVDASGPLLVPSGGAPVRVMREETATGEPPKKSLYSRIKEKAYEGLITFMRNGRKAQVAAMRVAARLLPQGMQSAADVVIGIYETILEIIESVLYAVIGILVGFGEGIAGMIAGLWGLVRGVLKLSFDLVMSSLTGSDAFTRDLEAIGRALLGLPAALKAMCNAWIEEFRKASSERQSLMIGELTGQVLALIATYAVSVSKIGSAARAGEAAAAETLTSGARGSAAAEAATQAGRPTLTVIKGGGQAASRGPVALAEGGAPAVEGNLAVARQPMPIVDPVPVPVRPVPKLVPPLPKAAPVAPAAELSTLQKAGIATGVGAARASRRLPDVLQEETKDEQTGCKYKPIGQQFGRYPCHADFATHLSGDRREFRVTTPEGLVIDFDAMDHGGTLYEVKTGYRWIRSTHPSMQERIRRVRERFVNQSVDQQEVADRCRRPLRWYFNEKATADYFRTQQPIQPPVIDEPFDCNADSDDR